MRILVDYRPALRARTGVGEYIREIVRAYTAAHDDDVVLFTSSLRDRPAPETGRQLGARVVDRRIPVRLLNYLWHRAEWPAIEWLSGRADVVHAAHPLMIPARRAAQVVTVHDLFFLSNPEQTHGEIRRDYAALAGDHARRADAIVTPSRYTKRQVVERFGVPAERVYACPFGAPKWRTLGREPNVPRDGYVLFIGTLVPRKNVGTVLDAYAQLVRRAPASPKLVIAGGRTPDADRWLSRLSSAPFAGRVEYRGYVSDAHREDLYAGARALVMPSLDEGFGVPALEAMSAGVPVVASDRGSLPEVVGDAGIVLDPMDVEGFSSALERIICDDTYAAARGQAGLDRARTFTWHAATVVLKRAYVDAVARRQNR